MTKHLIYRVTLVVVDLGWVDLYFDVPMSARFSWGQWYLAELAGQDDGTSESKTTQPRSATTLYTCVDHVGRLQIKLPIWEVLVDHLPSPTLLTSRPTSSLEKNFPGECFRFHPRM